MNNLKIKLSLQDSNIIKAIAILLIMSHNFFHLLPPAPGENEMTFSRDNFLRVFIQIYENPLDAFHPLVSFFGHYGVFLFLFLSGYGLTIKSTRLSPPPTRGNEIFNHNSTFIPNDL